MIAPCDPSETEAATRWCAAQEQGPVYLRLGKAGEPDFTKAALDPWVFGKIRRLREGPRCLHSLLRADHEARLSAG